MSIQQSIDRAATVGAALYTQTPAYEAKKAEIKKQHRINEIKATQEAIGKVYDEGEYKTTEKLSPLDVELSKELTLLDPTKENIKAYKEALETEEQFSQNRLEDAIKKQTKQAQEKKDFKIKVSKEVTKRGVAKKNKKRGEI